MEQTKSPFQVENNYQRVKDQNLKIWVVDGCCFHRDGKPHAGYAALWRESQKTLQGTVRPNSARDAEIVAVLVVLHEEDPEDIWICSDSDWIIWALSAWMPVWVQRGMRSADGRQIAHSKYLLHHAWKLASRRSGNTYLCKVKAHRQDHAEISMLSNKVDQLTKKATLLGEEYFWTHSDEGVLTVQSKEVELTGQLDVKELQNKDKAIHDMLKKEEHRNYHIF